MTIRPTTTSLRTLLGGKEMWECGMWITTLQLEHFVELCRGGTTWEWRIFQDYDQRGYACFGPVPGGRPLHLHRLIIGLEAARGRARTRPSGLAAFSDEELAALGAAPACAAAGVADLYRVLELQGVSAGVQPVLSRAASARMRAVRGMFAAAAAAAAAAHLAGTAPLPRTRSPRECGSRGLMSTLSCNGVDCGVLRRGGPTCTSTFTALQVP